jgi:hypothetical protein
LLPQALGIAATAGECMASHPCGGATQPSVEDRKFRPRGPVPPRMSLKGPRRPTGASWLIWRLAS